MSVIPLMQAALRLSLTSNCLWRLNYLESYSTPRDCADNRLHGFDRERLFERERECIAAARPEGKADKFFAAFDADVLAASLNHLIDFIDCAVSADVRIPLCHAKEDFLACIIAV